MLLRSVYQVVFLNILVESYCVSAQPQPKEDYLELATIIKEALDEDNSSEQVATDYADFVRVRDLIENKEIEPIDPRTVVSTADDDGSDCKVRNTYSRMKMSQKHPFHNMLLNGSQIIIVIKKLTQCNDLYQNVCHVKRLSLARLVDI